MNQGDRRVNGGGTQLPARVAAALAAAEIPPSKRGAARPARLGKQERALYFWILRRFVAGARPNQAEMREEVEQLDLKLEPTLARLAREDVVHLGGAGEIAVAYPFSGRPTTHCVKFASEREAYVMCAIDALGIAPMIQEPIEILSHDPLTRDEVHGKLEPDGSGAWEPASTVVVAGVADSSGASFCGCCPVVNFFTSPETAQLWLDQHPDVRGDVISIADAIAAGRAVFGDVLDVG